MAKKQKEKAVAMVLEAVESAPDGVEVVESIEVPEAVEIPADAVIKPVTESEHIRSRAQRDIAKFGKA